MNNIMNNILDISHNYYKYLINLKNVIGVGLGLKIINNIQTIEPCIHVLVNTKIKTKYLNKNNIIPKTYMGIKTYVIENGSIKLLSEYNQNKFRPLQSGCTLGISNTRYVGTLCCIVKKSLFLLSIKQ